MSGRVFRTIIIGSLKCGRIAAKVKYTDLIDAYITIPLYGIKIYSFRHRVNRNCIVNDISIFYHSLASTISLVSFVLKIWR